MVNKNDLRYIKTEDLILNTFRELCISKGKLPTVALLCSEARINKSTFYMHYDCIETLQKKVGRDTVHSMIEGIPDLNRLFFDVDAFVVSLISVFDKRTSGIERLFNSPGDMVDMIEQEILDIYIHPETQPQLALKVRYCVGGALRLLSFSMDEQTVKTAIELVKKTLDG